MNKYINLERIEFVVTMGCTGRCRHCSEGSHHFSGSHIDGTAAARAIAEVCRHYSIKSLMTFGGEPLLYPETVCTIHNAAKAADIPQREVITNGYFSKNENRIREVAQMLADSGVNRVLLSVDAFHQETIPIEPVMIFAEAVRNTGVTLFLSPAWLRSPEDDNPYNNATHDLLKIFTDKDFYVSEGNIIFPQGNAKVLLAEYFDEDSSVDNPYEDDPKQIRTLSFEPDGNVLGENIYDTDILNIINSYKP